MRNAMPREFYVPKGEGVVMQEYPEAAAVVYLQNIKSGSPAAMGFAGKQAKPAFNFVFQNDAQRDRHIAEFVDGQKRTVQYRAERAAAKKAFKPGLKVGDVLVSSGGYDQTNVQALQVVSAKGHYVEVREIGLESIESPGYSSMSDHVKPIRDSFGDDAERNPPVRKKVVEGDMVKALWGYASKWDGERKFYRSWYA